MADSAALSSRTTTVIELDWAKFDGLRAFISEFLSPYFKQTATQVQQNQMGARPRRWRAHASLYMARARPPSYGTRTPSLIWHAHTLPHMARARPPSNMAGAGEQDGARAAAVPLPADEGRLLPGAGDVRAALPNTAGARPP
eukprot:7386707-Prymnesium_polylepis.1